MKRPVVTVKWLQQQARSGDAIVLPDRALITPAAQDWLRDTRIVVGRGGESRPRSDAPVLYVIGDGRTPLMQTMVPTLERRFENVEFLPCNGHLRGLLEAAHVACEGLSSCSRRRGVLIVEDGATVNCVANRYGGVRAAILQRPAALFALQRRLAPNLLILETGRFGLHQIVASVEAFLAEHKRARPGG